MSGRNKTIIYHIFTVVFMLLAVAGTALLAYFGLSESDIVTTAAVLLSFIAVLFVFPVHTVFHELGHAVCGLICGMRVRSLTVGFLRFGDGGVSVGFDRSVNGAASVLPRSGKGARGKLLLALLGGAVFDFLYAAVMFSVYFALSRHPAVLFFAMFAPLAAFEGITALYPISLEAGPTDGKFALGLLKREGEQEVALRVMTAQGLLYTKKYTELPRELLFGAPVVREDCAAFAALLQLQWHYLYSAGEEDALRPLFRLETLLGYLPGENRREIAAELSFVYRVLCDDREKALTYDGEVGGRSVAALRAIAALEPTESNVAAAQLAAEREPMAGEREFSLALLGKLQ